MLGMKNPPVDPLRTNGQWQGRYMYGIRHHAYQVKYNICWGQLQGYQISILVINRNSTTKKKKPYRSTEEM